MGPASTFAAHQQRPPEFPRQRAEQFVEPESMTRRDGFSAMRRDEMMLRDADRIVVAHASRHLVRDPFQQRDIDIAPAREAAQTMNVELRVARSLIGDQRRDRLVDLGAQRLRHAVGGDGWRAIIRAGDIRQQEAKRFRDAVQRWLRCVTPGSSAHSRRRKCSPPVASQACRCSRTVSRWRA